MMYVLSSLLVLWFCDVSDRRADAVSFFLLFFEQLAEGTSAAATAGDEGEERAAEAHPSTLSRFVEAIGGSISPPASAHA